MRCDPFDMLTPVSDTVAVPKKNDAQAKAKVPAFTAYFNPILQCLRGLGGSATIEELNARVAESMRLSDEVLRSGPLYLNARFPRRMKWVFLKGTSLLGGPRLCEQVKGLSLNFPGMVARGHLRIDAELVQHPQEQAGRAF